MLGTIINAGAIMLGGLLGSASKIEISLARQQFIKVLLGVATVWFGLRLVWIGLASATARYFFYQLIIVLVGMVVGHLIGKWCRIQDLMNHLGQSAKAKLERTAQEGKKAANDGFMAATILFCAAPLGIVGALEDGMSGYYAPLVIKAVMDCLASLSFARMFGWMAMLSAVPVAVLLYSLSVAGAAVGPWLEAHKLAGVFHASAGLILTYIALVIFEIKKVEIANYLPALIVAPALMKLAQVLVG